MRFLIGRLINTHVHHDRWLASQQATLNCALLNAIHLIPTDANEFGYRLDGRYVQPSNDHRFKKCGEAASRLGPRYHDLLHAMFWAMDAGNVAFDDGLELASIQVPPAALAVILPTAGATTGWASHRFTRRVPRDHHHLTLLQIQVNVLNLPGIRETKDVLVELAVVHAQP